MGQSIWSRSRIPAGSLENLMVETGHLVHQDASNVFMPRHAIDKQLSPEANNAYAFNALVTFDCYDKPFDSAALLTLHQCGGVNF